jgi:hypothetical protein
MLGHLALQDLQKAIGIPTLCIGQVEILGDVPLRDYEGVPFGHRVAILDGNHGASIGTLDDTRLDVRVAELNCAARIM